MPLWSIIAVSAVGACVICTALFFLLRPKYIAYKYDEADRFLLNEFGRCNVMVFGKKRQGKDLIFAHVIAMRGVKHYANIPYDENTEVIELSELNVGDNTFKDFINGTIEPFSPRFDEGLDVFVSDCGIYLPCHYNAELNAKYPSMPIFFALSGQLYDMRVHINSQALGRPWDKLREQADSYIQVLRTVPRDEYLYTTIVCYDKYTNAEHETNPIAKYTVRIPISELTYDSRYFREFLFDCPPSTQDYLENIIWR